MKSKITLYLFSFIFLFFGEKLTSQQIPVINPSVTTVPMLGAGDRADDPCVWIHPNTPAKSVVLGVNKSTVNVGGLYAFDLNGNALKQSTWEKNINLFEKGERYNNVDVKYNFDAGQERWDIVCTSNRSDQEIDVFKVNRNASGDFQNLEKVGEVPLGNGFLTNGDAPYGLGMFHNKSNNRHYVIISDKAGKVAQYRLDFNTQGIGENRIRGTRVTAVLDVSRDGLEVEGIVADDEKNVVYIAAEDSGIYRYPTNAEGVIQNQRITVDSTAKNGVLNADVEGLTMYYGASGDGYLIASVQGKNQYAVYRRTFSSNQGNDYLKSFALDDVQNTDGIDVTNVNLGGNFSSGMFLAHDGVADTITRYKFVKWDEVANSGNAPLDIDTGYDPRSLNTPDDGDEIDSSVTYLLRNAEFGTFLDGDADNTVEQSSNDGRSKRWELTALGNRLYALKNIRFNRWLSTTADGRVILVNQRNGSRSEWRFTELRDDVVTLVNRENGKYLDADSDGSIGLSNNPKLDDEWELVPVSNAASLTAQVAVDSDRIALFPNPANEATTLEFSKSPQTLRKIHIYSLQGNLVKTVSEDELNSNGIGKEVKLDVQDLAEGLYVVSMEFTNKPTTTMRLVVNR